VVFFSFKYPLSQLLGAPQSSTPAWCMTVGPRALLNKNPLAICNKTVFSLVILGCRLS
ncbi:mCG51994, partial [Mus musculus]